MNFIFTLSIEIEITFVTFVIELITNDNTILCLLVLEESLLLSLNTRHNYECIDNLIQNQVIMLLNISIHDVHRIFSYNKSTNKTQ